jgi:hypothetical protein
VRDEISAAEAQGPGTSTNVDVPTSTNVDVPPNAIAVALGRGAWNERKHGGGRVEEFVGGQQG